MADTSTPAKSAPTAAIGYTHAPTFTWWLDENETTPELQFPQSVRVFDQMRRTDSQVTSVLEAVCQPVERTPWRIDPNGARAEVVQFVADDFGLPIAGETGVRTPLRMKGRFSWKEHLRLALLMLPYGFSYFEQLYRVEDDGSRAHLAKLEFRPQMTIDRVEVATDGGLVYIQQCWTAQNSSPRPIPVDRLVAYVHRREGGNWLGQSILRPVYKNWLLKDRLLRVQAQTIERNGMGIPVYEGAENEDSLAAGLAMATSLRSGEAAGAATPYKAKLRLMGVEGQLPDAKPVVEYHDQQIARAVLAHFLNLGTQTGSWALGSTFADFFTLSLQTLAQQIADTTTRHVIEDLVDVNWGPDEPAPRLCFDEIGSRQQATAEALKSLVDAGIIHPDEPLEGATRQFYGLPPADPATATPPPGQPVGETPDAPTQTGEYSVAASEGVDLDDEALWIAAAAGVDTHPGGERLKRYWLFGAGAAKWATWTELYDHLRKYIENTKLLKATVSKWYLLRYGHTPPHHKGVHASALTGSPEALAAYAEEFGDPDADDEAEDWELQIDALAAAMDELSGAVAASFNPRQARNPKGSPGAGRFRSMVDTLKDAIENHRKTGAAGHPFASFDREQLRRVARKRGIELSRGEPKDSIAEKLLGHLRGGDTGASVAQQSEARMSLDELTDHLDENWHSQIGTGSPSTRREMREHAARVERETRQRFGEDPAGWPFEARQAVAEVRVEVRHADLADRLDEEERMAEEARNAAQAPPRVARLAERQSKAGQKAAGIGVREESPTRRARRERIERLTNEALDERARRDAPTWDELGRPEGPSPVGMVIRHEGGTYERLPGEPRRYRVVNADGVDISDRVNSPTGHAGTAEDARIALSLDAYDRAQAKANTKPGPAKTIAAVPVRWDLSQNDLSAGADAIPAEQRDDVRAALRDWKVWQSGRQTEGTHVAEPMVNAVLRGDAPSDRSDRDIAALDAAMGASRLTRAATVYRGFTDGTFVLPGDWDSRDLTGTTWHEPTFPAASADRDFAELYVGEKGNRGFLARIKLPKGSRAVAVTDTDPGSLDDEKEIILPRGLTFRVVKDNGPQGKYGHRVLDVEVVEASSAPARS